MMTLPNRSLLDNLRKRIELEKRAFVPAGDPSAGGSGGGAPPMDPAMMGGGGGGAPPMDPAMMDPSMIGAMGGGAPPAPPPSGGMDDATINKIVDAVVAKIGAGGGGGGGGAGGGGAGNMLKPKIDINVEFLKFSKNQAKMMDFLGIPVSAADQVATAEDLTRMAQQSQQQGGAAPAAGGIPPMAPMQPMGGGAAPPPAGGEKQGFDYGRPISPTVLDLQESRQKISAGLAIAEALRKYHG